MPVNSQANGDPQLYEELQAELESARSELEETRMMLEQSRLELERLAQRSASVTARLRQVQAQVDVLPASEVKTAYEAALEAQQRLFVLRGRLDQLEAGESRLHRLVGWLERLSPLVSAPQPATATQAAAAVEMAVQAQEAERARLAKQMHDEPAQALSNFILQTEIALRLFEMDPQKARVELEAVKTAASAAFQKVRGFIFELRPLMLDDLGLGATLSRYAETVREKTGADVQIACIGLEERLEPYLEVMLFRAVQELVDNALRHGGASQVRAKLEVTGGEVQLSVEDNGKGFDSSAALQKGSGLWMMGERVEKLGGSVNVSASDGQVSKISLRMPAVRSGIAA
jgi:two-component system, NarL family, sensor histidine kinase DegS